MRVDLRGRNWTGGAQLEDTASAENEDGGLLWRYSRQAAVQTIRSVVVLQVVMNPQRAYGRHTVSVADMLAESASLHPSEVGLLSGSSVVELATSVLVVGGTINLA